MSLEDKFNIDDKIANNMLTDRELRLVKEAMLNPVQDLTDTLSDLKNNDDMYLGDLIDELESKVLSYSLDWCKSYNT